MYYYQREKMKCKNCKTMINIDKFGGYQHYISTKKSMDENVRNGYYRIIAKSQFEMIYQCIDCHTKWALAEPDFPIAGYLEQR